MSITRLSMMEASASSEITSSEDEEEGSSMSPPAPKQHDDVIKSRTGVYKKNYERIIATTEKTSTIKRKNSEKPKNNDACLDGHWAASKDV
ncbi:hypothetical protein COBT_000760 [Conglomerata obtusa]